MIRITHADGYRAGVAHLRAYISQEGHTTVSRKYVTDDGFKLGSWVNKRRYERRAGTLSAERISELSGCGMVWGSSRDAGYRAGVDHLRAYTAAVGHAVVPHGYVPDDGFGLGVWVANRRRDRRNGRLSAVKIAELTALGMVWSRDAV